MSFWDARLRLKWKKLVYVMILLLSIESSYLSSVDTNEYLQLKECLNLSHMSNDRQLWLSLFLKRKLSENLGTESWLLLFSKTDYHLTFWVDFLQNFRSYLFQSTVFTNIISNSTTSNCIFRKMLNIEILENFASAKQFEHQNHQFSAFKLISARWLSHILWEK